MEHVGRDHFMHRAGLVHVNDLQGHTDSIDRRGGRLQVGVGRNTLGEPHMRAGPAVSTTRRRGNSEGSNPVQRADGRWQVHIRHTDEDGSSSRHTVYGSTAKEARDKAADVRARLRANLPAKDRKITLGEFTSEWIDSALEASDRKATTKNLYSTMARTHIIGSRTGARPLDKLRPSHIDAWKVELKDRGLAESSIRTAYTVLRAVLDTAVRDKAIADNPAMLYGGRR
jgi:hypothetical protein